MRDSFSIDDHSSKQLFTANSKFPSFLSYLLRTSTNKIHLFGSRQTPFPFFFFFLIPSYPTAAEMFLLFRILILHYVYIPSSQVPTSSSCWFLVLHVVSIPNSLLCVCMFSFPISSSFFLQMVWIPMNCFVLLPSLASSLDSPAPNSLCLGSCRLL